MRYKIIPFRLKNIKTTCHLKSSPNIIIYRHPRNGVLPKTGNFWENVNAGIHYSPSRCWYLKFANWIFYGQWNMKWISFVLFFPSLNLCALGSEGMCVARTHTRIRQGNKMKGKNKRLYYNKSRWPFYWMKILSLMLSCSILAILFFFCSILDSVIIKASWCEVSKYRHRI